MTTLAPGPTAPPGTPRAPGAPGAPAGRWRRRRTRLLLAGSLVLAVVVVLVLGSQRSGRTGALDPENPGPDGAQGLARVLAQDGVDVEIVRSADALDAATVDAATTVVVTMPSQLGRSTADRLVQHAGPGRLVVVDASAATLRALGVADGSSSALDTLPLTADCPQVLEGVLDGLTLDVDDARGYQAVGSDRGCLDGAVVVRGGVTLLGAGEALTDDQVLRADNAAIALRLLGGEPHLVWYVPTVDDLVADDGVSVRSLLPASLAPGGAVVALALVALMLWRGRRLGPLAVEPLPVVVKAIETTRSRGRLYRRSGDRGHAARVLRSATRARLADRLHLGAGTEPHTVVAAVAAHLDRPVPTLSALLLDGADPTSDPDLVHLATTLAELEREVRNR